MKRLFRPWKTLLATALSIFVLSGTPIHAAGEHWEFAGWYGGGCYPNLSFDPHNQNRVYLTSDVAGIWRSDDLGDHWHFINQGLGHMIVAQVAIAPSDANVLYAATNGGMCRSLNAGESWQTTNTLNNRILFKRPDNYRPIAINPKNPQHVCVGTAKGDIFCSLDSGDHWNEISVAHQQPPAAITALSFDSDENIFFSSNAGLFRCAFNDNLKCNAVSQAPTSITDFVFSSKSPATLYAAGEDKMWISPDSGQTWTQTASVPNGKTYRIALDESGPERRIYSIWNKDWKGGVVVSRDEGQTWQTRDSGLAADQKSNPSRLWASKGGKSTSVHVDPFDANVLFRTDWWGVWRSDDGGTSWNERIIGSPNTVATDIVFSNDGSLYVASMDDGLLKSDDAGKTYQQLFPQKYDRSRSGHVWRVLADGDNIIATSSPWEDRVNQVIVSHDRGKTFDLARQGLPNGRTATNTMWGQGYPRALAVDPQNPRVVYLGIDGDDGGGLFVSNDHGFSWVRSEGQPGSLRIYRGLSIDPTDSKRLLWGACAKGGGIYISQDAGKTFHYAFKEMQWVFATAIGADGVMYAAGDSNGAKLYASKNHGKSWFEMGKFDKNRALASITVNPSNAQQLVVSTVSWGSAAPNKIYLSNNGGRTWTDITGDLPDGSGASSITFDPSHKFIYITRYAGSVYRLAL